MIVRAVDAAAAAGIPIAAVQHSAGEGAPVFAPGTPEFELHPDIERRRTDTWKGVIKQYGSVYAGTDLADWLRGHDIDTVTLVGHMTNNCILASAVEAESLSLNSNWAAVSTTDAWADALEARQALKRSDLGSSAIAGTAHLTRA
jgi:nicotinamidase-related amidase